MMKHGNSNENPSQICSYVLVASFVANDGQSFERVLKFDEVKYYEDSLLNEEMSEVLQKKELIDELLYGGTQLDEYDMKVKKEK